MTKQLLVMRHAKSSWAEPGLTDFERPLNKRGLRVAPQVAQFIQLQGLSPHAIISSSACRTKMTSEIFIEHCEDVSSDQLTLTKDFYHAPASTYLECLTSFSNEAVNILMFIGHNPGLEDLVQQLSGRWEVMPTAAVAHFDLEKETWEEVKAPFKVTLKNLWRPKEIDIL